MSVQAGKTVHEREYPFSHCYSVFPHVYSSISQLYLHSCSVLNQILISDSHSAMHYASLYDYSFVYVTGHMIDVACKTTSIYKCLSRVPCYAAIHYLLIVDAYY